MRAVQAEEGLVVGGGPVMTVVRAFLPRHLLQSVGRLGSAFCGDSEVRLSGPQRLHVLLFLLSLNVSIECKRVSGLEAATVDWAFDLTKTNMQTM